MWERDGERVEFRCDCELPGHFQSGLKGVLAHVVDGVIESDVERCDSCERFLTDDAADLALVQWLRDQGSPDCGGTW